VRVVRADGFALHDVQHPVAVGLAVAGAGFALPLGAGRPDMLFAADGQITKAPVRAHPGRAGAARG
jgi:precorrin-6Y C5,15-methyltransferase (decarboxylating)